MALTASDIFDSTRNGVVHRSIVERLRLEPVSGGRRAGQLVRLRFSTRIVRSGGASKEQSSPVRRTAILAGKKSV